MNAVRMRRLMVVSGTDDSGKSLADQVSELGYHVASALTHGEEALRDLGAASCDLVVLDERVAGDWDGPSLAAAIRDSHGIPVVFVGSGDSATFHRVRSADPYGYVCAPVNAINLRVQLDLALHRLDVERERALSLPGRLAAHARLQEVEPMLPICGGCNRISSHEGRWVKIEEYFSEHAGVQFTHSFCPGCEERLYGQKTMTCSPVKAKH